MWKDMQFPSWSSASKQLWHLKQHWGPQPGSARPHLPGSQHINPRKLPLPDTHVLISCRIYERPSLTAIIPWHELCFQIWWKLAVDSLPLRLCEFKQALKGTVLVFTVTETVMIYHQGVRNSSHNKTSACLHEQHWVQFHFQSTENGCRHRSLICSDALWLPSSKYLPQTRTVSDFDKLHSGTMFHPGSLCHFLLWRWLHTNYKMCA